jgi:hypothetical protein
MAIGTVSTVRRGRCAMALTMVLAGCASSPPPPTSTSAPKTEPERQATQSQSLSRRAERYLKALPNRPLNVAAQCSFTDPDGYRGRLDLGVRNARVQRFEADVEVPGRGNCRFDLRDFQQTADRPVTLKNRKGDCAVHIWEQGEQVTVAFGECRSLCSGGARDYLWPILVNAGNGSCS